MKHINHANVMLFLCSMFVVRSVAKPIGFPEALVFISLCALLGLHRYILKLQDDKLLSLEKENEKLKAYFNELNSPKSKKIDSFRF